MDDCDGSVTFMFPTSSFPSGGVTASRRSCIMTSGRSIQMPRIIPFGNTDGFDDRFATSTGMKQLATHLQFPRLAVPYAFYGVRTGRNVDESRALVNDSNRHFRYERYHDTLCYPKQRPIVCFVF